MKSKPMTIPRQESVEKNLSFYVSLRAFGELARDNYQSEIAA